MSLPGSSAAACMDDGPRGRAGHFQYDGPVVFNNKYRQTLDETGQPLLKNIFQSKFEHTDKPEWVDEDFDMGTMGQNIQERRSGKRVEGCTPSYLEVDKVGHFHVKCRCDGVRL